MPKINVYLPDRLAEQVRAWKVPVSNICQHALQKELNRMEAEQRADELTRMIVSRLQSQNESPEDDSEGEEREQEGYEAGLSWARDSASAFWLSEFGSVGIHGDEKIPVGPGITPNYPELTPLYRRMKEANCPEDSSGNCLLTAADPWGRGFLRAVGDIWPRVQPLLSPHDEGR